MRRVVLFKIGSRDVQLPRMIGAFLIVIAVLMLINSGAVMFDSWKAVKEFNACTDSSGVKDLDVLSSIDAVLAQLRYQDCKDSLFDVAGVQVPGGETQIELWKSRQFWRAMIVPIAQFFGWAIVFLFALFLFNNASIVVPVEEIEIPLRPFRKEHRRR